MSNQSLGGEMDERKSDHCDRRVERNGEIYGEAVCF
ncbi:hypothetical protein I656_04013 [Geobacillus sp. WSUCF1]|nr:hypothetical protein I656_04013 [Geobacillus sp. WSUCF1]